MIPHILYEPEEIIQRMNVQINSYIFYLQMTSKVEHNPYSLSLGTV